MNTTPEAVTFDLANLHQLQEIHRRLASGYHISEQDLPLWQSLSSQPDAFEALFSALGYQLVADIRGFFYFAGIENTPYMGKTARRFALTTYALVEWFADSGRDPVTALLEDTLDRSHCTELLKRHKGLFEALEITTPQELEEQVLRRLVRFGFARENAAGVQLLPPIQRFIDAVLELGQAEDAGAATDSLPMAPLDDEELIHA
jgi:hypothetical protein